MSLQKESEISLFPEKILNYIDLLPWHILKKICLYLPVHELRNLKLTNNQYQHIYFSKYKKLKWDSSKNWLHELEDLNCKLLYCRLMFDCGYSFITNKILQFIEKLLQEKKIKYYNIIPVPGTIEAKVPSYIFNFPKVFEIDFLALYYLHYIEKSPKFKINYEIGNIIKTELCKILENNDKMEIKNLIKKILNIYTNKEKRSHSEIEQLLDSNNLYIYTVFREIINENFTEKKIKRIKHIVEYCMMPGIKKVDMIKRLLKISYENFEITDEYDFICNYILNLEIKKYDPYMDDVIYYLKNKSTIKDFWDIKDFGNFVKLKNISNYFYNF